MWSNGMLAHPLDLVLYCPLRNSKIATATTLADLFEYKSSKISKVVDWFSNTDGEGLLIIFDGWDELCETLKQSSLVASIIHRKELDKCSVIVTSRSYASSSLLEMSNLSRHIQVIGFAEEEIPTVIIQTLQKDAKLSQELIDYYIEDDDGDSDSDNDDKEVKLPTDKDSQLAMKLINDLKVRNDVQSLCYVPLVCSMSNLKELEVKLTPNQSHGMPTTLFYEQVLPAINMLQSHTTIRLLRIECGYINNELSQPNWIELVQQLYETLLIHPSLEYIQFEYTSLLANTLQDQKKTLTDRHRKEQPHKPLPIMEFK
ncbi:PREDICTED: uncharacterized protein LOC109581871 [Amphimedon queenslandica]|uniref:NACHT domain-containing protein n=1 Tax=Amphimedon queenslandica TaxID=400682 RepID=A0AAN0J4F5_AMPQE|nr:PREDICTED: uncharacterized protein LOC109581871 [Amphimedon queenslandica]|eukprot:XP_019851899.1 PREDICTED: uncharacterized protein LOC109581871 [Amphimedon queenslandica]